MPGLAGIISREPAADHTANLALMLKSMTHEAFYVSSASIARDAGVYAGWVAHPGSFAECQSRCLEANGIDIGFAGECVDETISQGHPNTVTIRSLGYIASMETIRRKT